MEAADRKVRGFFVSRDANRIRNGEWQTVTTVADYWHATQPSSRCGQIATSDVSLSNTTRSHDIARARATTRRTHIHALARRLLNPSHGNPGANAMNHAASLSINPLFLRHDLMIELGRLEMAIDDVRLSQPAANDRLVNELETKCARINEALSKLPA
jgi:hypothetical protein